MGENTKLWTDFAPVGRLLKRRRKWTHILRPPCLQQNKTCMHVLQCPAYSARTQQHISILIVPSTFR